MVRKVQCSTSWVYFVHSVESFCRIIINKVCCTYWLLLHSIIDISVPDTTSIPRTKVVHTLLIHGTLSIVSYCLRGAAFVLESLSVSVVLYMSYSKAIVKVRNTHCCIIRSMVILISFSDWSSNLTTTKWKLMWWILETVWISQAWKLNIIVVLESWILHTWCLKSDYWRCL